MYVAAVQFVDLQDGNRRYEAGEKFPREGLYVSKERIAELAGSNNRMGYPLIVAEKPVEAPETKPEQSTEPTPKPAKKPRRKRESNA